LLLDQQANFLAFGSKARIDYANQDENGMLFEKFKMRLHDDHRGSEPIAFALNGKTAPLLKVITHSLKYVKEDAMAEINRSQVVEREREEEYIYLHTETYVQARTFQTKSHTFFAGCSGQKVEYHGDQVGGNGPCHLARCCKGDPALFLHIFGFLQTSTYRGWIDASRHTAEVMNM